MDFSFSPEAEDLRARFRTWLDENLRPEWRGLGRAQHERLIEARREFGVALWQGGWLAAQWPREVGGLGYSAELQAVLLEELVRAGAPEALNSNGIRIFAPVLIRHGNEDQKQRHLPRMLSHEEIWCQGFSEPNAGSDLASLSTRAELDGDRFVVNGQKTWTTNGQHATMAYVLARTAPELPKHRGISLLMVDMRSPGVSVLPIRDIIGGTEFSEVFFDDVVVPRENLVGELNGGWKMALEALASERGIAFAERALRMQREFDDVLRLVAVERERGNDRAADPGLEGRLVDVYVGVQAMRSLVLRVLSLIDAGQPLGALSSMAKLYWSETHQQLLSLVTDLLGERVADPEHENWLSAFLFSRVETVYAGTSEIQRNLIAKELALPTVRGEG